MKDFHFFMACEEILPDIKNYIKNREVVIWGAGNGGKICKYVLEKMDIKISFFVDSRISKKEAEYEFEGLEVKSCHVLNKKQYYCIIAVINPFTDILLHLKRQEYLNTDYCYISNIYTDMENFAKNLKNPNKYRLLEKRNAGYIKFSVIIPIYNRENYIEECINSVLAQSYPVYEIILVDDGSKDKSGEICDNYAENYPYIKVIHKRNEGVSIARNTGIREASGEYIFFLDSDDRISVNAIESFYNIIKKYPDLDFVHGRMRRFKGKSTIIQDDLTLTSEEIYGLNGQEVFIMLYLNGCLFGGLHGVYRRKYLLELNNLYIEHLNMGEDLEFNIRIFANTSKLAINDVPVYEVRTDTEGSLMKISNLETFFSNLEFYRSLEKQLCNENYSIDFIIILKRLLGERFVHSYFAPYIEIASQIEINKILSKKEEYEHFFEYYSLKRYQFYIGWINEFGFETATLKLKAYMEYVF